MSADPDDAAPRGIAAINEAEHRAACLRAENIPLPIVRPNVKWLVEAMRAVRSEVVNDHVPPSVIANTFLDQWLACAAWSVICYLPDQPDVDRVFDIIWETVERNLRSRVDHTREEFKRMFAEALEQHQAQARAARPN